MFVSIINFKGEMRRESVVFLTPSLSVSKQCDKSALTEQENNNSNALAFVARRLIG